MASNSTTPDLTSYEGIDMSAIFSPFYWGTVVSLILSGITILQAYNYFPSKDRLIIQILALIMITLDLADTGLISQALYYYLVPHFGSLLPLQSLVPTLAVECVLSVIITVISQTYFAWQIQSVKGAWTKTFLPSLVMVFALVSFVSGIGCSVEMVIHNHNVLSNKNHTFVVFAGINKAGSAVADIIATAALCYQLVVSRTGVKQTDSKLRILMQYVIQRGVLLAMIQTLVLVIFLGTGNHVYWLGMHVNVTRMYANTFFAMLNGRQALREGRIPGIEATSQFSESGATHSYIHHSKFITSDSTRDGEKGINITKSQTVVISNI